MTNLKTNERVEMIDILVNSYISNMDSIINKYCDKMNEAYKNYDLTIESMHKLEKENRTNTFLYRCYTNLIKKHMEDIRKNYDMIKKYNKLINERMNETPEKDKILYLEKRGCDFWDDEMLRDISDVGNYRVGIYDDSIRGKDGNHYTLEFGNWNRIKPGLRVDMQYILLDGYHKNIELEEILHKYILDNNLQYTLQNILKIVNIISKDNYTSIAFINN